MFGSSPSSKLNKNVVGRYTSLPLPDGVTIATYVWIDLTGERLCSKDRTLDFIPKSLKDLPTWSYGGTTNYEALKNSDIYLRPVALYKDPHRGGNHVLVMCECSNHDQTPIDSNKRRACSEVAKKVAGEEVWFGIEQEYTLLDSNNRPLGWPECGFPAPQGSYGFGVGTDKVIARDFVDAHYRACLYAGVKIYGTNAEVMPSQWEYQVGPCVDVKVGDDIWISRYILHRVAEDFGVIVTLDPKPMPGDWNGAGAHTNVSTKKMRAEGGLSAIQEAINKLSRNHSDHIKAYDPRGGKDNERRLTGFHRTSSIRDFSSGVADRSCSIRIPRDVADEGKGYFEDRRPSSNCDPYAVVERILRTICLDEF